MRIVEQIQKKNVVTCHLSTALPCILSNLWTEFMLKPLEAMRKKTFEKYATAGVLMIDRVNKYIAEKYLRFQSFFEQFRE